ncbi:flagellar hook-length control protein FliK [Rhizobium rhizophilum]|uniref:Flagellar hook-length control protein FliK n=1 Tax=Rhizobium rhizophilum TaxID=1850373 RepID=A0ABY2R2C3_9HYPH|nr:flagellar hook-length control protein FliK [Rhizobium rhizophilum]THV16966.1 flagellar hook-length control protein FliK [Rhizobium rhizophilum]
MTMMDALSAPRLPDSAASTSHGRSDKAEDGGGFAKVLSSSGEKDRGSRDKETAADDPSEVETADAKTTGRAASAKDKRPLIDIGNTPTTEFEGLPADLSVDELARLLAAVRAKGKDQDGDTPGVDIQGLDPKLKAELAKALAAARDKKASAEGEPTTAEPVSVEDIQTDTQAPDLIDVLKLLAGGEAATSGLDDVKATTEKSDKDEPKLKMADASLIQAVAGDQADASNSEGGQSQDDRDFRFVRADGKGQPLLLRGEGTNGPEQSEQKAVETVTVVDSRRYIAPVSTTNAASITAAMVGDGEWVSAMSPGSELANAAAQSSQGKVVHTLKLQMSPIELGSVTATLRLSGDELSVQLTVDNAAALRQLTNDQSDILKALRAQGLVVDQVQVTMQVASTDRTADTGQNASQGQQSGQQTSQPGSQGGSERQQQGETAGSGARAGDERVVQATDTATSDARGARPDQLYL